MSTGQILIRVIMVSESYYWVQKGRLRNNNQRQMHVYTGTNGTGYSQYPEIDCPNSSNPHRSDRIKMLGTFQNHDRNQLI